MKDMSGLDAAQQILQKHPSARILLLTTFSDDEYIVKALRIGTKGYLLKQDYAHIIPAIRAVYDGQTVFGDEIVQRLPDLLQKKETVDFRKFDLSEKEVDIIQLVADGLSNKEIAEALCFGEGTVRNYLSTILNKLNLRDRTQLAIWYLNADKHSPLQMQGWIAKSANKISISKQCLFYYLQRLRIMVQNLHTILRHKHQILDPHTPHRPADRYPAQWKRSCRAVQ